MSISISSNVWRYGPKSNTEKLLLLALADFAGEDGTCFPGIESLRVRINRSARQTIRLLAKLVRDNWLIVSPKAAGMSKKQNLYTIRSERLQPLTTKAFSHDTTMSRDPAVSCDILPHSHVTFRPGSGDISASHILRNQEPPVASPLERVEDHREEYSQEESSPRAKPHLVKSVPTPSTKSAAKVVDDASVMPLWKFYCQAAKAEGVDPGDREAAFKAMNRVMREESKSGTADPPTLWLSRLAGYFDWRKRQQQQGIWVATVPMCSTFFGKQKAHYRRHAQWTRPPSECPVDRLALLEERLEAGRAEAQRAVNQ